MKLFLVALGISALLSPALGLAQPCGTVVLRNKMDLPPGDLHLSDLLTDDTCPALRNAAHRIRLGEVPLAGSPRVFTGETIRELLRTAVANSGETVAPLDNLPVPQRIIVRRAGKAAAEPVRASPSPREQKSTPGHFAVHPGDTVELVWDQGGIRSVLWATCLDRGAAGDRVRVRLEPSGRTMHAVVESPGILRVG
jgi:hypothetical protein